MHWLEGPDVCFKSLEEDMTGMGNQDQRKTRSIKGDSRPTRILGNKGSQRILDYRGMTIGDGIRIEKALEDEIQGVQSSGQSTLYAGRDRHNKKVVIKIYDKTIGRQTLSILETLKSIRHEALLPILECGLINDSVYEVQPLCLGGTLADSCGCDGKGWPIEKLRLVVKVLAEGLRHLHENHCWHKDVKPSNIFWLDKAQTKPVLADFGIAAIVEQRKRQTTVRMTPMYSAPEVISAGQYEQASDYFSAGISLLEMACGRHPFEKIRKTDVDRIICSEVISVPDSLEKDFRNLLAGLLTKEVGNRYGYAQMLAWVQNKPVAQPAAQTHGQTDNLVDMQVSPVFPFGTKEIRTLRQMTEAMRANPEVADRYLVRDEIGRWLDAISKKNPDFFPYGTRLRDAIEREQIPERRVYRAIYILEGRPLYLGKYEKESDVVAYIEKHRDEFIRGLFDE